MQAHQLDGDVDDVAIFAGALTAAELAARWDQSLTDRAASGLEPDLVLFWNFNDPLAEPGYIRNIGTAGAGYDLRLGALPKPAVDL